jgi:hypothetical protein
LKIYHLATLFQAVSFDPLVPPVAPPRTKKASTEWTTFE